MRDACQSDLTSPSLFLVSAQPCVFPCLNIKAALAVDLCASIQDMLFCPKISYVVSPLPVAPVNEADMVLLPEGLKALKRVAKLTGLVLEGAYLNLDGGFDSKSNRKAIFNLGYTQNSPDSNLELELLLTDLPQSTLHSTG